METNTLQGLRNSLPYQYAKLISQNLNGISRSQVRKVFTEEISDLEIVEPVLREAKNLQNKMKRLKKLKEKAAKL